MISSHAGEVTEILVCDWSYCIMQYASETWEMTFFPTELTLFGAPPSLLSLTQLPYIPHLTIADNVGSNTDRLISVDNPGRRS